MHKIFVETVKREEEPTYLVQQNETQVSFVRRAYSNLQRILATRTYTRSDISLLLILLLKGFKLSGRLQKLKKVCIACIINNSGSNSNTTRNDDKKTKN